MNDIEREKIIDDEVEFMTWRSKIEEKENWRDWAGVMPALHFDSDWEVKILPPFAGALARFVVRKGEKRVSVYFDAHARLGAMYDESGSPEPYFEAYNFELFQEPERYLFDQVDMMMNSIREYLNKQ